MAKSLDTDQAKYVATLEDVSNFISDRLNVLAHENTSLYNQASNLVNALDEETDRQNKILNEMNELEDIERKNHNGQK